MARIQDLQRDIGINMPFKSQAQRAFLYANEPAVAQKFEEHTPKGKKLPAKLKKTKSAKVQKVQKVKKEPK